MRAEDITLHEAEETESENYTPNNAPAQELFELLQPGALKKRMVSLKFYYYIPLIIFSILLFLIFIKLIFYIQILCVDIHMKKERTLNNFWDVLRKQVSSQIPSVNDFTVLYNILWQLSFIFSITVSNIFQTSPDRRSVDSLFFIPINFITFLPKFISTPHLPYKCINVITEWSFSSYCAIKYNLQENFGSRTYNLFLHRISWFCVSCKSHTYQLWSRKTLININFI